MRSSFENIRATLLQPSYFTLKCGGRRLINRWGFESTLSRSWGKGHLCLYIQGTFWENIINSQFYQLTNPLIINVYSFSFLKMKGSSKFVSTCMQTYFITQNPNLNEATQISFESFYHWPCKIISRWLFPRTGRYLFEVWVILFLS